MSPTPHMYTHEVHFRYHMLSQICSMHSAVRLAQTQTTQILKSLPFSWRMLRYVTRRSRCPNPRKLSAIASRTYQGGAKQNVTLYMLTLTGTIRINCFNTCPVIRAKHNSASNSLDVTTPQVILLYVWQSISNWKYVVHVFDPGCALIALIRSDMISSHSDDVGLCKLLINHGAMRGAHCCLSSSGYGMPTKPIRYRQAVTSLVMGDYEAESNTTIG